MVGSNVQTERLGQIVDYLYVPPSGNEPEEAVVMVLDLEEDRVRVGPDLSEATLVLARQGAHMTGRFVRLLPSLDPKQVGHLMPVDVGRLDQHTRREIVGLIQTGYCVQPPPDSPTVVEGDEV